VTSCSIGDLAANLPHLRTVSCPCVQTAEDHAMGQSWAKPLPTINSAHAIRLQISRKASRLRSPLLHAVFDGGPWDVMTLDAVLQDGSGMTRRVSLLDPPPARRRAGEPRQRPPKHSFHCNV